MPLRSREGVGQSPRLDGSAEGEAQSSCQGLRGSLARACSWHKFLVRAQAPGSHFLGKMQQKGASFLIFLLLEVWEWGCWGNAQGEEYKIFGWTFVPRHLELQFIESKATQTCILIVLGQVPLPWDQGALMNRLDFYSARLKEVGPSRSLCARTWVTLQREGSLQWDLLCKMVTEESLK